MCKKRQAWDQEFGLRPCAEAEKRGSYVSNISKQKKRLEKSKQTKLDRFEKSNPNLRTKMRQGFVPPVSRFPTPNSDPVRFNELPENAYFWAILQDRFGNKVS